jgi:DtxR family Mn-dependent transcriptional regulator
MAHFAHHFEENYLKALYKLSAREMKKVNNIALSKFMDLNPATVLEMIRKMSEKGLVVVAPDKSIALTEKGQKKALLIIRRHRLWEVFLVQKLKYSWSEVHELAEQMEHVESDDLVNRLDAYLGFPAVDPHGDPIPDKNGKLKTGTVLPLSEGRTNTAYLVTSFADTDASFLDYLGKMQVFPGTKVKIVEQLSYDGSSIVKVNKAVYTISEKVARNILVQLLA